MSKNTLFKNSGTLLTFGIILLVAVYGLLMISYVRTPLTLKGADFMAFYSAGRVARQYGLGQVYNAELESAAQAQETGLPITSKNFLPPNHPPFLFPWLTLLAGLGYRPAYFGYALLLLALVATSLPLLYQMLCKRGWPPAQTWIALTGVLLFEPLFISILKGQDSALLLLGGLLWFAGLLRDDDRLAGLGLSLTLIRPQVALLLAIPFVFRRRKVWGWFCAGATALGVYSIIQVGWTGVKDYLHLLTLSAGGQGFGMSETAMFDFVGLLLRLAPRLDLGLVHALGWGLYAAALVGLCALWRFSKTIGYRQIALAVCLSLFAAPHLHYHDLTLLVVPLLGLGLVSVAAGRLTVPRAASLPVLVSVVLLFGEFLAPIHFIVPYLLMAGLPVLVWLVDSRDEKI